MPRGTYAALPPHLCLYLRHYMCLCLYLYLCLYMCLCLYLCLFLFLYPYLYACLYPCLYLSWAHPFNQTQSNPIWLL